MTNTGITFIQDKSHFTVHFNLNLHQKKKKKKKINYIKQQLYQNRSVYWTQFVLSCFKFMTDWFIVAFNFENQSL